MTPTYEVVPGKSLGPFQLGDSLWHILDVLRTDKTSYPKIELAWDTDIPHKSPITLHLTHPPLTLYFPQHQRLEIISIPLPSSLTLTYDTQVLSSPSANLSRSKIGRILGPTFESTDGKLHYPGIDFYLQSGGSGRDEGIIQIRLHAKTEQEAPRSGLRGCFINPGRGITLQLPTPLDIILGETTSQDILLDLGTPLRKYWKEDDRMQRMWGQVNGEHEKESGGCFWTYFQHGLDFLIDGDGIVVKVLVHSNIPGTPLFQRYARCPWTISSTSGTLDSTSPLSTFRSYLSGAVTEPSADGVHLSVPEANGGKKKKRSPSANSAASGGSARNVTPEGKDGVPLQAMYLDRVAEGGLEGVNGLSGNRLYGFEGLVVEEDQECGGICSVLVYKTSTQQINGS